MSNASIHAIPISRSAQFLRSIRLALFALIALTALMVDASSALARDTLGSQRDLGVSATVHGRCSIGTSDLASRGRIAEGSIALGCVQGTIAAVKVALAGVVQRVAEQPLVGIVARGEAQESACGEGARASLTAERARSNGVRHYSVCGAPGAAAAGTASIVTATILF